MAGRLKRLLAPENALRVVEVLFTVVLVSTSFGWKDKGVSYFYLDKGDYDEGDSIAFVMVISLLVLQYVLIVIIFTVVYSRGIVSPFWDIVFSGSLSLLTFISTVVLANSLSKLGKSFAVREAGLNFSVLQVAVVFGLALALLLAVSTLFAFCFYRNKTIYRMNDSRSMTDLPDDIPT